MHKRQTTTTLDQTGLVSILVTMILMVILSLIVLGFAQVTRREQRQSLDRQLNSQAQYAAETGINDVQKYIKDELAAGNTINTYDKCGPGGPPARNFNRRSGGSTSTVNDNTTYSCALINPSPTELIWQRVATDGGLAFPFKPASGSAGITFNWQDADTIPAGYGNCTVGVPGNAFKPQVGAGAWACEAGALRIDVTPISGSINRAGLLKETQNYVLYPVSGGGVANYTLGASDHGKILPVQCTTLLNASHPRHCQITLGTGGNNFFIRIKSLYRASNIEMTSGVGGGIGLSDAQALVDVTGKANDILKRLQVRIPINILENDSNSTFDYAIQSTGSICKQAAVVPGQVPSPITNADPTPGGDTNCP